MLPEIGNFALILAFCLAIFLAIVPLIGALRQMDGFARLARPMATGQFVFVAIAFGCLAYAFMTDDFSVLYVATNSNSALPDQYKFSAIWGGHEGSLLLWALFLCGWMVAVAAFSRNLPMNMIAIVLSVMGWISSGFLSFMLFTSNPFARLLPAAVDGRDLNPLLQDFGLVIHPPMLYLGYVGFSVAFAFAIAALISGRLDATWTRWTRPWTLAAWVFLTMGVALGSWWAYYELGWGGWWFWDPVENASFMPWLAGTALVHALAVSEKRGAFRNWTVLLAIVTFSLSLLGTFLVRSGVLVSVHSFASDPSRGLYILIFLFVVIVTSLGLYIWRAGKVGLGGDFQLISRETFILIGNVLLTGACAMILLATLYPIIYDALFDKKLSVGLPFFNLFFVPIAVIVAIMMGIGPLSRWKQEQVLTLVQRLRIPFIAALVTALLIPYAMGEWKIYGFIGMFAAFWIIFSGAVNFWERWRLANKSQGKAAIPLHFYGMSLAHLGVAISMIGVTMVTQYEVEQDVRMDIGDTVSIGGYQFRFNGATKVPGPNYIADRGELVVSKNGQVVTVLFPEKRLYRVQRNVMTEADIDTGLLRDLYVALGEPLEKGAWSVRVYYKPFVDWIWGGAAFMALGGFCAMSDRRYRVARRNKATVVEDSHSITLKSPTAG